MNPVRSFRAALVAVAVLSTACTDATSPTPPEASLGGLVGGVTSGVTSTVTSTVGGLLQFVTCSARPEKSGTFTVDSRGGTFSVDYATVTIPRNAVAGSARRFEMRTPSARINSVIFTPVDGRGTMTFRTPVTVQLQYRNCLGNLLRKKEMVYTTDENDPRTGLPKIITVVGDLDNLLKMTVEGQTSHFSRYAVSY